MKRKDGGQRSRAHDCGATGRSGDTNGGRTHCLPATLVLSSDVRTTACGDNDESVLTGVRCRR